MHFSLDGRFFSRHYALIDGGQLVPQAPRLPRLGRPPSVQIRSAPSLAGECKGGAVSGGWSEGGPSAATSQGENQCL